MGISSSTRNFLGKGIIFVRQPTTISRSPGDILLFWTLQLLRATPSPLSFIFLLIQYMIPPHCFPPVCQPSLKQFHTGPRILTTIPHSTDIAHKHPMYSRHVGLFNLLRNYNMFTLTDLQQFFRHGGTNTCEMALLLQASYTPVLRAATGVTIPYMDTGSLASLEA